VKCMVDDKDFWGFGGDEETEDAEFDFPEW
jgi:hypothetical protein